MHSMQRMTQTYQYDPMLDIGILNGVKAHKATGPDEVLVRLLKEAADQLAPIFWVFYRQSIVLVEWRTANVIPIFKKVNHTSSVYYRPVSLTSVAQKLWNIISSQIMRQASIRSCPMHDMVSERSANARRSCCCHAITSSKRTPSYFDFAKAFDKFTH